MSKKPHSGLKRALAWMLTVAMMAQGCIVYADDFTSEPDAAVVEEAAVSEDVDTSADSDLESADEGEDTSTEADVPEISDEDLDTEVVADDQQDTDEGSEAPLFSDGSEEDAIVSDGAEAVGDDTADIGAYEPREGDVGTFTVAGNDVYEYHRYRTTDGKYSGKYRFAVANYPVNNATITMAPYETRQFVVQSLVATNYKTATDDVTTTQWWKDYSRNPSYWPHSTIKWALTEGSDHASIFGETNPVVTISAFEEGDVTLTGTWTGYNCNTSSKKYKACELVVTYKIHITPAVGKVNFGDKFVLSGSPTSQDIIDNSVLTESDSWGEDNAYTDFAATRDESGKIKAGMKECTMSYKAYPSKGQGTINHNYYVDFHEMIGKELNTTAISPDERAKLQETFRRDVSLPAPGIYVQTPDPVSIPKKGDYTFITTQAFNGGNGAVSSPAYTYKFMDDSASEYADDSSVITATTADKGKVKVTALKPGATSMKIIYSYTDKTTGEEKTAESKPIRITVNGIVFDEPATITLSADEAKDYKIKYKLFDYSKENPDVTTSIPEEDIVWSIDNKAIASISTDGVIRPKKEGSATVTLKATINGYQDTATQGVTVTSTGGRISLNKDSLTMTKGSSQSLTATAYYNNQKVSDAVFNWATDNDKVATVDGGKITAVGYGKTVITASWKAENGTTYAVKADVEVVQNGIYLTDAQNEVTMPQGSTQEIAWTLWNMGQYKAGSTGEGYNPSSDVTWKSADEAVATVDSVGVITAKDLPEGQTTASTTVTVSYKGTKVKDIKVNVTENQKVVVKGEAVEITGTKGETKTNKAGEDITDTWKIGYFENGHGSLNAQFYGNGIYNIDIVKQAGEKVSVTGKTPYSGYIYLSHKYYVPMETGQLYGVWQSIAIKVNGEAGLYLNKNSLSMKMGESGTATILGTFIKEDGTELERKFWADKSNPKLSKLEMVEGDTNIVTAQSDPADGRMLHLTAVSPGKTTITIKCYPFDPTATCEVEVTSDARLILQPAELTVKQGTTEKITAKAWDGSAYVENPQITWKSYNESIATVDGGVVTGVKRGNATVSAAWNGVNANDVKVTVTPSRNITLSTEWDDHDNQDGIRPASVSLQLKSKVEGGEAVNVGDNVTVKADADGNWTKTWTDLPKYNAGKVIEYTVEESGLPEGYTITTTKDEETGAITLKNSYTPKGVDIAVSVNWNDADNQDGLRPEFVEAELYAGDASTGKKVKLTADNEWKATFEGLAVNKNGKPIEYSLVSTKAEGYEIKTTGSATEGLVLNYTHAVKTVDVKATVVWADGNNRDGVRPETVSLQLKADGENLGDVITVNEKSKWTKTWTGLGEYKAGKEVVYTVEVVGLKGGEDGYTAEITGDAGTGFTITATHVPAVAEIKASVNWDDAENQDAIRPEFVEAELYADDVSTGKKVKLTADNKWTASFGEMDLKKNGKTIDYTLVTTKVDGYDCVVEGSPAKGLVLKYSHTTYKTDVTVTTKWDDADNQDGIRPNTYSVQLTADGEAVGDAITLNEAGNFTKTWKGLEKNKAGKAITYSVKASDVAKGYEAVVSSTESGIVVTLTHTPEVADIAVSAAWDDADNQDGIRPASVEAEVLANGEATGNKVTLTAEGEWKATVKALPVYAAGQKITYTLKSDVDAYTSACTSTADGLVLKFTHKTETVDVTLTTKWNDKDNQDNVRPASYYVQLLADGVKVGDKIILESASDFSKTWTGLQKNRTGKVGEAIVYTAEVTGLPESYETSVSGDAATGLVVTNTYIPATVEIPVSVKWDDAENQDGVRLDSVEAELYADGEATGNKVTLNAENSWTAKFAQVDVKKDGTRIKYEVKSTEKEGYTVSVSGNILDEEGLTLNYKHVPATVNISAKAAWNDAKNQDGIRPTDTLVQLYADGEVLGDKAVLESGKSWTKTWAELPKYKAGKEIAYKVVASAVSGYSVKVSGDVEKGYTVTYAHSVAKTKVTVKNTWNDLNNVVDSRPSKLVVEIYANGKATGKRVTLTSANKWTATVSNLNKKSAGKVISYTGKVVGAPSGYSISIKSANGTVNVTSKYTKITKKLNLKLSKTSYVYTGKNLKPTVTVYNGKKKVANKYYTVTYKNNKNTGYATVIVKGKGKFAKYAGKASFTIRPKQMRKPSVKSTGKKTLAVGWVRDAQATKYVVQYSQNNKFRGKTTKSVTINKNTISKTTLKGLASGRYYYVRVRSYKVANGKNIYAPSWSQVVKVRVK